MKRRLSVFLVVLAVGSVFCLLRTDLLPAQDAAGQDTTTAPDDQADSDASDETEYSLEKIQKSDREWRRQLTRQQYSVTRKHATERPRTGKLWNNTKAGVYHCVCCDLPVFDSTTKFKSGTGWPSFYQPLKPAHIETAVDYDLGYARVEVHCRRCDGHLGHVFRDGPRPTGLRYCLNGVALKFKERVADTDEADGENE